MSDLITVTNNIGGTVVVHAGYRVSGRSNTVDIPQSYLQAQEGARTSLATLITSGAVRATFAGSNLTAANITSIGTYTNYWQHTFYQATIATAAMVPLDVPLDPCNITKISATVLGSVLAAGESMTVDIQKINPATGVGVSILLAPVAVDDTTITVVAQPQDLSGSLDTAAAAVGSGWPVVAVLTYVPGGGATGVDFMLTVAFSALD